MGFAEASNNGAPFLPFLVLNPKLLLQRACHMKRQPTLWLGAHQTATVTTLAKVTPLRPSLPRNHGAVDPLPPFRVLEKHLRHEQRAHHVGPRAVRGALHRALTRGTQRAARAALAFPDTTPFAEPVAVGDSLRQRVAVAGGVHREVAPVAEDDWVRRIPVRALAHTAQNPVVIVGGVVFGFSEVRVVFDVEIKGGSGGVVRGGLGRGNDVV